MADQSLKPCDLVMKGGITSGIVYPPAVLELQKTYTFKSIGGTSAGAMAAAATAAAEYNRAGGGFKQLEIVRDWLSQDGNLLGLFQPTSETQPLFDALLVGLRTSAQPDASQGASAATAGSPATPLFLRLLHKFFPKFSSTGLQVASQLSRRWDASYQPYRRGGWQGLLYGILFACILVLLPAAYMFGALLHNALVDGGWQAWLPLLVFGVVAILLIGFFGWLALWFGRLVGVLFSFVGIVNQALPENGYGICRGHATEPQKSGTLQQLTDWLSPLLDAMAGLPNDPTQKAPLTFAQLASKEIDLKMVTSNLSLNAPCVMPADLQNYLFSEKEMRRYFPADVVDHLIGTPPLQPLVPKELLPDDYHFLPDPQNLPVILCTRMSLSFPMLLSAVPLYTLSAAAYTDWQQGKINGRLDATRHLQHHWFSDGGICSNFPIQFFDAWLPTRPTFGINLTGMPTKTSALGPWAAGKSSTATAADCSAVYLPDAEERQAPEWLAIDTLPTFLQAIFGTAQNYHDTLQSDLPSYRERIVQVRLAPDEGGMHLTMPPEVINKVAQKGVQAGEMLADFQFEQHWWVRYLVLMARLEEQIEHLHVLFDDPNMPSLAERLQAQWSSLNTPDGKYAYYRDRAWCEEALCRMEAVQNLMLAWQKACDQSGRTRLFQTDAPMPTPTLRVTPEL